MKILMGVFAISVDHLMQYIRSSLSATVLKPKIAYKQLALLGIAKSGKPIIKQDY